MTRPDDDEDDNDDIPLNLNVGYKAVDILVDEHENGQSILDCFPHGDLHPQPFVEGEGCIFVYIWQMIITAVFFTLPRCFDRFPSEV
jgi:hypothetical protein